MPSLSPANLQLSPPPFPFLLPPLQSTTNCHSPVSDGHSSQTDLFLTLCLPLGDRNLILHCRWHVLGHLQIQAFLSIFLQNLQLVLSYGIDQLRDGWLWSKNTQKSVEKTP